MARAVRIERAGGWYHVTARGNERRAIYRDLRDRQHFCAVRADTVGTFRLVLHVAVRGNVVRSVDERYGAVYSGYSYGVKFNSCERTRVEDNVIDLGHAAPIDFEKVGAVEAACNQTPSGVPIRGYDREAAHFIDDVTTMIEDAQILDRL